VPVLLRPGGADRRALGIAFRELHLRPTTPLALVAEAGVEPSHADQAQHSAGPAAAPAAPAAAPARNAKAAGRGGARAR
jgi:hypothetical protein